MHAFTQARHIPMDAHSHPCRYKHERVPFDFGCLKEVQKKAVGLAKYSLKMIQKSYSTLAEQVGGDVAVRRLETLIETALRFSFRCHQFAGGFDNEATKLFAAANSLLDKLYKDEGTSPSPAKQGKKRSPTKAKS